MNHPEASGAILYEEDFVADTSVAVAMLEAACGDLAETGLRVIEQHATEPDLAAEPAVNPGGESPGRLPSEYGALRVGSVVLDGATYQVVCRERRGHHATVERVEVKDAPFDELIERGEGPWTVLIKPRQLKVECSRHEAGPVELPGVDGSRVACKVAAVLRSWAHGATAS